MINKIQSKICNKNLEGFVFNASGINNEVLAQLQKIHNSGSAVVMLKSCTLEQRKGNLPPKYLVKSSLIPGCTFNSMGLPNKGIEQSLEYIDTLKKEAKKPIFVSTVGVEDPLKENQILITKIQKQGLADFIEVNLSCPNIEHSSNKTTGKTNIKTGVLAYDFESLEKMVTQLAKIQGPAKIGFKLPPYTDSSQFEIVSQILLGSKASFISSINTLPALVINPEKESVVIKPKKGQGGLGGDFIKPLALYNVHQFFERIGDTIDIIGVGGIRTGSDAFEYALAGAKCVQVGSAFAQEGVGIFSKIHTELKSILDQKGYQNIQEVIGKLKFL